MIVDISSDIQSAVRALILNANIVPQVYDYPPSGIKMPYITIGELSKVRNHTKDIRFNVYNLVLHVWTSGPGRVECQNIMGQICDLLDNTNLSTIDTEPAIYFLSSTVLKDPDGTTQHGVLRFEIRQ